MYARSILITLLTSIYSNNDVNVSNKRSTSHGWQVREKEKEAQKHM